MATVTPTLTEVYGKAYLHTWALLTADHTGVGVEFAGASDRCVQFVGTNWGGATAVLEGSNDGATWLSLTDPQGNAISKTADGIEAVLENPRYIRARLSTVGTAAVVGAYMLSRSTMR